MLSILITFCFNDLSQPAGEFHLFPKVEVANGSGTCLSQFGDLKSCRRHM